MREWLTSIGPKAVRRLCLAVVLSGGLPAADGWMPSELIGAKAAFADDDDDGGDDDDDDGGGRSGGYRSGSDRSIEPRRPGGGNLFRGLQKRFSPRAQRPRAQRRAAVRRPPAPQPPPPLNVPNEIVAVGLTQQQTDQLATAGFTVLDRDVMAFLGSDIIKLRIPPDATIDSARDQVRAAAPGASIDYNHYFRPGQDIAACEGQHCVAPNLVGWPVGTGGPASCGGVVTIGLIDTAINPGHATFASGQLEVIRLTGDELPESGRQHGTAVAALLAGSAGSTTPGLLPGAKLIAVDAFHRGARQDDRSDAYELARAMDLLAARKVDVVNMSLSGPANMVLEQMVGRVAAEGIVLVAAAGNKGPKAEPVYPAAYPEVLAVTAVDRRKQAYRRAGQGDHVDLAAPGVEVWTAASISGARPKTGTSFAAPFVTAAAALAKSSGKTTVAEIHDALTKSAEDLGEPGKDPVYGWGLLDARALCGATQ